MAQAKKRTASPARTKARPRSRRKAGLWNSIWPLAAFGAILVTVAIMLVVATNQRTAVVVTSEADIQRIGVQAAQQMAADGDAVLYDTRSLASYHAEHATGALPLPEAELAERIGGLPRDEALIFYCT